ncbi:Mitogen-activated protein kinase 10 [Nymphaea thermarum]|nr:Mitogen-activated protein kinase 10 [Nymphaea thermarum]
MGLEAGLFSVTAAARVFGSQGDVCLYSCMSGLVLLAILVNNLSHVKSNCGGRTWGSRKIEFSRLGTMQQQDQRKKNATEMDFFTEYGDANRYRIQEVIGKGSYGVVCSAIDTHTGEKVAIKKIHDIFEHISDATRILREIKLLRLLRHPDIVEIKHIMLPPSRRDFKDIFVVFELMESDLHQVIKANDDLTKEHYQFFLYQLLRALKYIHTGMQLFIFFFFLKSNENDLLCQQSLYQSIELNVDLAFQFMLNEPRFVPWFLLEHELLCTSSIHGYLICFVPLNVANVYHRDLKPKNILANANCKLKICDFGLARVAFNDTPTTIFWTDYVATRWYRAPELCGSFFSKYTPAIDIWSIGCIFAEVLTGKPLFPGKNVVHQLDLITDLLGTPSLDTISRVRNEKARRYLTSMRKKHPVPFSQKFPNADPLALKLLERLLAFDPKDRPTAEEALADPYFKGLARVEREPSCQPITKMEFEFERRRMTKDDVRELIFREILEYHPQLLKDYMNGTERTTFLYPSAVDQFKRQFAHLEENGGKSGPVIPLERKHVSLPRSTIVHSASIAPKEQVPVSSYRDRCVDNQDAASKVSAEAARMSAVFSRTSQAPQRITQAKPGKVVGPVVPYENGGPKDAYDLRRLMRGAVLPPQYSGPASYSGFQKVGRSDHCEKTVQTEKEYNAAKPPCIPNNGATKVAEHIAIDMNSSPFYLSRVPKAEVGEDRSMAEANYLHAKSQFNGVAAATAASSRKMGAVQYGMSRMY